MNNVFTAGVSYNKSKSKNHQYVMKV